MLHRYPASWHMKWLNSSLINGIWNLIFVLSNVSLFIFLPFAYLFCESEGLPFFGNKRVSKFISDLYRFLTNKQRKYWYLCIKYCYLKKVSFSVRAWWLGPRRRW